MLRIVSALLLSVQVAFSSQISLIDRSTIYENPIYAQGKFDTDDFSDTCLDKLCLMMESFTSCKVTPISYFSEYIKLHTGFSY